MYVCKYSLLIPLNQRDIILIPLEANHKKKKTKPQTTNQFCHGDLASVIPLLSEF